MEVVIVLPDLQFLVEIDIVSVGEQLAELLMVGEVGPFDFAIKPGRSRFDIVMPDPQVFNMPKKSGLKLMAVIGPYGVNAEGESFYHMVDELDGSFLVMTLVDLQSSNPRRIIDSRVLEPMNLLTLWLLERQELNINLDMTSRYLLLVALSLNRATLGIAGKPVQALVTQDTVGRAFRNFQLRMIALNLQANALWSQVVSCSQMNDFLLNLRSYPDSRVLRTGLVIDQPLLPELLIQLLQGVERLPSYSEMVASPRNVSRLLVVFESPELSLDISFRFRHSSPRASNNLLIYLKKESCQPKSEVSYLQAAAGSIFVAADHLDTNLSHRILIDMHMDKDFSQTLCAIPFNFALTTP